MKHTKSIALLLALLLAFALAACAGENIGGDTSVPHATGDGTDPAIPGIHETAVMTLETVTSPINPANAAHGSKTFILPKFDPADETAAAFEALVASIAEANLALTLPNIHSYFDGGITVNYAVTEFAVSRFDEKIFSARVSGTVVFSAITYDDIDFVYTVNIALADMRELEGKDIIADFPALHKLFTDGKFTQAYGMDGLLAHTNYRDMISQYPAEYGVYPGLYLTDDMLIFNINLARALGSNAGFSIPLTEAGAYLKDVVK